MLNLFALGHTNKSKALKLMPSILGIVLLFHFLIFFELIPYDQVWAGKISSVEEMKTFETFSILMNAFMILVLYIKLRLHQREKENKFINVLIWIFVLLFALNTIGNLFAKSLLELVFGTLLTLTSTILCFVIVRPSKST